MKKAILAFSGGLDTSFCIPYLQEKGYEVVTVTVNTGGFTEAMLNDIAARAKTLGVKNHYTIDAQKNLYENFASFIIKGNYLKGGVYPACVGPERTVIAIEVAKIAKQEKSNVLVHGSTGAGNDQVRFDLALKALIPNVQILAPIRDENLTRSQETEFLKAHGFPVKESTKDYSINVGLLGTTIGGKETKNTTQTLPDDIFPNVKKISDTPDTPLSLTIEFEKGLPEKLNGKKLSGVEIIQKLNHLASANGFGKGYHIGTALVGIKGRIGFEAPALQLLIKSKTELEKVVLTSKQIFWKNILGNLYGDLIHEGLSFDPLVKNLEAFLNSANEFVTGEVKLEIYKGNLSIISLTSPHSLFNTKSGTYGEETGLWNGQDAKGFCTLYGLESVLAYLNHNQK